MLPSHFECVACGLKIAGYSKLTHAGLAEVFTSTAHFGAADYFDIPQPSEMEYYEEDFNE